MANLFRMAAFLVTKIFGDNVLRWVATKALAVTLVCVVLPIILNNLVYDLIEIFLNYAMGKLSSSGLGGSAGFVQFVGIGAWLATCFKLPECLSVLVSAYTVRFSLKMIPFVRL